MHTNPKEKIHNRKDVKLTSISMNPDNNEEKQKKENHYFLMKYFENRVFKNIVANILLFLATIFYLVTLVGCEHSQAECLKNFDQTTIKYYVMILTASSFMYSLIISMAIYKHIHYSIPIYTSVLIWYLCYVYDTGTDLKYHGSYNRVFLFILMIISFLIQQLIILLFSLFRKIRFIKFIIGLIILVVLLVACLHFKLRSSCDLWTVGLGGKHIDNSIPGCKIKTPYYCWMNFMDNVFDVSGWLGENCEQIRMDNREQVIRWTYIPEANIIGFPRVEKYKFFPDSTLNEFQFKVLANMIDMENPKVDKTIKNRTEIILDFNENPAQMKMRVVRDEKIAEKRQKIRKALQNTNLISKNVIHLFIDSLSRDNFRRKLSKTRDWLEKYYNNKKSDARVYQFFKYHAIASWTFINMVPVNFGVESSFIGNPTHHNKYFKDKGFILGQAQNHCGREFFDIEPGNVENFLWEPFDHEANLFSCDPNYSVPGHPYSMFNGPYGMKRRCLYGKDTSQYIFDYGKHFWNAYPDEAKYLRLSFSDAHEGSGEVVKYMDDKIINFFEFLEKKGSLKDTIIIIQADHGVNMPGFYTFVDAEDFWIEKTLPTLFLIVPQEVANKYNEILENKENMMLSPYDIHNTFLHLAGAPKMAYNNIGVSMFLKDDDVERRTCDRFKVVDPYCQCMGERDNA